MNVATAVGGIRILRTRLAFVGLVLVLAAGMLLLVQQRADAQVNIGAIACPILLSVRSAFANSPFFSFIEPILNALLSAFGCSISG